MWIERGLDHFITPGPTALTIGAFDGVHRGHQQLIETLVNTAHAAGQQAVAMTFDPLPWQLFGRGNGNGGLLTTLEERLELLAALGLDGVVILPFSRAVAATPALEFVAALSRELGLAALWAGPDFALGRGREGDIAFLQAEGARSGFTVHVLPPLVWRGEPVRSSRIREALRRGDLDEANDCLGRPYRLSGTVAHGDERGRRLGFPTANLALPADRLLPAYGIYVCRAVTPLGTFSAVTNVGIRPTFDRQTPLVEAYLLDFAGDLYGQPLALDFLARLRPEMRFPSAEALVAQMHEDAAQARAWLGRDDRRQTVDHEK